jgi:hypothetical protein
MNKLNTIVFTFVALGVMLFGCNLLIGGGGFLSTTREKFNRF